MRPRAWRIGGLELDGPFILAPLAGITDAPFRRICKAQGAALVFAEMASGKGLCYNSRKTEGLLRI
ncbi:MAG: tRNA-dihydrouridine synthase, partial [Clostridiales Family XIII bacterium]|nr:tRNA-dihydrouridine synthase [Clostridiales Family XIII bacterium]